MTVRYLLGFVMLLTSLGRLVGEEKTLPQLSVTKIKWKHARPVLRGGGDGNAASLPDEQTGHANEGCARHFAHLRVSRLAELGVRPPSPFIGF